VICTSSKSSGSAAVAVVERQRNFGHPQRLARGVAGEDDVFHLLRAQAAARLLAEHPADRVDEVRLPEPFGPTTAVIPA
jgi:hypothetical protein